MNIIHQGLFWGKPFPFFLPIFLSFSHIFLKLSLFSRTCFLEKHFLKILNLYRKEVGNSQKLCIKTLSSDVILAPNNKKKKQVGNHSSIVSYSTTFKAWLSGKFANSPSLPFFHTSPGLTESLFSIVSFVNVLFCVKLNVQRLSKNPKITEMASK